MTKEEIIEGNKLIADFMQHTDNAREWSASDKTLVSDYKYNSDWNQLMKVVERIEQSGCIVEIWMPYGKGCKIHKPTVKTIANTESNICIEAVWDTCVDFIKWSNSQNSNTPNKS